MSISFLDRSGFFTPELREFTERRLMFALSRFSSRVQSIAVVVSNTNGPRGAVDKHCRISVKLNGSKEVILNDQDADLATCLARASERVGRAVGREIIRSQHFYLTKTSFREPEIEA